MNAHRTSTRSCLERDKTTVVELEQEVTLMKLKWLSSTVPQGVVKKEQAALVGVGLNLREKCQGAYWEDLLRGLYSKIGENISDRVGLWAVVKLH